MRKIGITLAALAFAASISIGCGTGVLVNSNFQDTLVGADGQVILLEDLEGIANDPDLTDDEKRQAFRDLGIEDDNLIDALLPL